MTIGFTTIFIFEFEIFFQANELNQSISNENELIEFMKNIDAQFLLKNTDLPLLDRRVAGRMVLYHSWNLIIEGKHC